jgi:hypothetical protein
MMSRGGSVSLANAQPLITDSLFKISKDIPGSFERRFPYKLSNERRLFDAGLTGTLFQNALFFLSETNG